METSRRPPFKGLQTVSLLSVSMALQKRSKASRTNGPRRVVSTILIFDADIHHPLFFQFWKLYRVIHAIQAVSGWVWSDDTGASITPHSASSWDDYVKSHPEAKPFRNKGWRFFTKVSLIMPSTTVGANVFHPTATLDEDQSSPPPQSPIPLNNSMNLRKPQLLTILMVTRYAELCLFYFSFLNVQIGNTGHPSISVT